MRITSIELAGFRAFGDEAVLDLAADAVILVGPNGSGKTSVLDGILWSLAGRVPRIDGGDESLVSMYSSTGGARVALGLRDANLECIARRTFDGERSGQSLRVGGQEERGPAAQARLLELLWPDAVAADEPGEALTAALTRSVYLQQDRVRQFIEADSAQERFVAVSELVGAGRIAEFQVQLDRERTAWSRATNERIAERDAVRTRLTALESRLSALAEVDSSLEDLEARWSSWWEQVRSVGLVDLTSPSVTAVQASQALDVAVQQLSSRGRQSERMKGAADELLVDLAEYLDSRSSALPDISELQSRVTAAAGAVEEARERLAAAEAAAADERRRQTELRDAEAELQSLAQLALRHLDERCPVCDQDYDQLATRERLERLVAGVTGVPEPAEAGAVSNAADALQRAELTHSEASRQLRDVAGLQRSLNARGEELRTRLEGLSLPSDLDEHSVGRLRELSTQSIEVAHECSRLQGLGESLAVEVARSVEAARRGEIQAEIEAVRSRLQTMSAGLEARERAGRAAVSLLEGLREASSDVVRSELERVDPLLQQIFSTVDPHPAFRAVRLLTRFANRRGRVSTQLEDSMTGTTTSAPEIVLSSSQLNGLAVSVFLTLNLGMRALPLDALILDDPLQSLDDVNLLGLVDLLRRTREHRQVIVSTHDAHFGELLARKLRPVTAEQRTLVHHFVGWNRSGPTVESEEVRRDPSELRIASNAA